MVWTLFVCAVIASRQPAGAVDAVLGDIGIGIALTGLIGDVQWSARAAYPTHLGGVITNTTGRGVWRA